MWAALRRVTLTERAAKNMTTKAQRIRERAGASCAALLAQFKERLATTERRLENAKKLREAHDLTEEDYSTVNERYQLEGMTLAEKVREIEKRGDDYWREPLLAFIKEARESNLIAQSENMEDLRNWHKRVGTRMILMSPDSGTPVPYHFIPITKPFRPNAKHPGRRHSEPILCVRYPYPWRILAERPKNVNWQTVLTQLVAYFKDPSHPDYTEEEEDARASLRRGRKRQWPRTSAPPEGGATGLGTSSPTSTGAG
jgi:hypothetical protein